MSCPAPLTAEEETEGLRGFLFTPGRLILMHHKVLLLPSDVIFSFFCSYFFEINLCLTQHLEFHRNFIGHSVYPGPKYHLHLNKCSTH